MLAAISIALTNFNRSHFNRSHHRFTFPLHIPKRGGARRGDTGASMTMRARWSRSPEDDLLTLCARGGTARDWAGTLGAVQEWDEVEARLLWHRLAPLFVAGAAPYAQGVPSALWARLRGEVAAVVGGNLELLVELGAVLECLRAAGVRALCWKGAALALGAYGGVSLRAWSDIDLIVSPDEVGAARRALAGLGYADYGTAPLGGGSLRAWRRGMAYETALLARGSVVDLHWGVASPFEGFPYDFEALWRRRHAIEGAPLRGAWTLGGEELVAALCFHGLKHAWEHMEWIGALSRLVDGGGIAWSALLERARQGGTERVILLGAALAEQLGAHNVPPPVSLRIACDPTVRALARQVWERGRGTPPDARARYLHRFSMGLRARRGWARARFAAGMVQLGALYLRG